MKKTFEEWLEEQFDDIMSRYNFETTHETRQWINEHTDDLRKEYENAAETVSVDITAYPYVTVWGTLNVPEEIASDDEALQKYISEHFGDIVFDYKGAEYDFSGTDYETHLNLKPRAVGSFFKHRDDTYEVVDKVPTGFVIWNVGTANSPIGYLPLCEVLPPDEQPFDGALAINPNTLKALWVGEDGWTAIMNAVGIGEVNKVGDIPKFINIVNNSPGAGNVSKEHCRRYQKALPYLENIVFEDKERKFE